MDETPSSAPSQPEPRHVAAGPASASPARRELVHLPHRPSGLWQALGLVVGLFMFGAVFCVGLAVGGLVVAAGALFDGQVVEQVYRDGSGSKVAVIPVTGIIDGYQADTVRLLVDHTLADPSVKACVLRVDSPGGAIAPSDQIWYQVQRMQAEGLPVVASFGGVAASGGYYISCAADHIVAEPTTVTGSIGVIAQTFVLKDLMDKVGIEPVTLLSTDSPEKDVGNPFRHWTEKDRETYVAMLDSAYEIFNTRVREGRQHVIGDPARVDELANGSIYTAAEALESGLVDAVGYLDDAIDQAEQDAGLVRGRSTVIVLGIPEPVFGGYTGVRAPRRPAGLDAESVRAFVNEMGLPRLMYLMR